MRMRRTAPASLTDATLPISVMMPVNISASARRSARAGRAPRSCLGLRQALKPRSAAAARQRASGPSAGTPRLASTGSRLGRERELVDEIVRDEHLGAARAALAEDAGDAAAGEETHGGRQVEPAVARSDPHHLGAFGGRARRSASAGASSVQMIQVGASRAVAARVALARQCAAGCRGRRAPATVLHARQAHGELRIVGQHGADADHDRVGMGADQVDARNSSARR